MILTISFEYDTGQKIARVISTQPRPPFGIGDMKSVLFDGHSIDDGTKVLRRAIAAAIKGNLPAITAVRPE
jgi:hypothetical protein